MKLVQIQVHFEYAEAIEDILDALELDHFARYPDIEGSDAEGKHFGSQVFPGHVSVVQVQVSDERVDPLLGALREFRDEKKAHHHLEAFVLPIERVL